VTEPLPSGRADERWGSRLPMMMMMMTLGFLLADDMVALAEIGRPPALRKRLLATFRVLAVRRQSTRAKAWPPG
jgi:hypothetical protein